MFLMGVLKEKLFGYPLPMSRCVSVPVWGVVVVFRCPRRKRLLWAHHGRGTFFCVFEFLGECLGCKASLSIHLGFLVPVRTSLGCRRWLLMSSATLLFVIFFWHSKRGGGGHSLLFIGMVFSFGDRDHSNKIFVRNA